MRARRRAALAFAAVAFVLGACSSDDGTSDAVATTSVTTAETTSLVDSTAGAETTAAEASTTAAAVEPRGTLTIGMSEAVLPGDPLAPIADAVQVQFDAWNADGGVAGYQLELVLNDGGMTPDAGASAARQLIEQEGVVALLASQNPADCLTNRQYYVDAGVPVIGLNAEACADAPIAFPIAPEIGSGFPVIDRALSSSPGQRIAAIGVDVPSTRTEFERLGELANARGATVELTEYVPFIGADANAVMVRAKQADVDVVYLVLAPQDFAVFLGAAQQQGIGPGSGATWIGGVGAYADVVAAAVGANGEGMLAVNVTDEASDGAGDAEELWTAAYPDVPFAQEARSGFTLAWVVRAGIEAVEGDVTRPSLLEAMGGLSEVSAPFLPDPLDYTTSPRIPALGVFSATLQGGAWVNDDEYLAPIG
jgi:branched-chain amino acid transport system substrate-binding protein